ncbi:MAG: hypothetical protein AB1349_01500 [Elusimicrobiota bacterium]
MAYIRKKRINNKDYYYLVKSKKTGNRILQKHIAYLGKTPEEAQKKKELIEKQIAEKEAKLRFWDEQERNLKSLGLSDTQIEAVRKSNIDRWLNEKKSS